MLYLVARCMAQGRTAGLVATLGIHVGTLFLPLASIWGLLALFVSSAPAFSVLKYWGAAYLIGPAAAVSDMQK